jgi:hypothetical protein
MLCKFNRILSEGVLLKYWEVAVIIPFPKIPILLPPSDYRSISPMPLLSKVVEKYINELLFDNLEPHLSNIQFGFGSGISAADAILLSQNETFNGFAECKMVKRSGVS